MLNLVVRFEKCIPFSNLPTEMKIDAQYATTMRIVN